MRRVPLVLSLLAAATAQNSTARIRPDPSPQAARVGTAVPWRTDLDAALAEAGATGKPVFWYVPTLAGSPMDRRPEIDRYAMAGPFSWPFVIAALREHTVPVRLAAGRDEQRRFGLRPGPTTSEHSFVEPGVVVLDGDGEVLARCDQLVTFHPAWWRRLLARCGAAMPAAAGLDAELDRLVGGWEPGAVVEALGDRDLARVPAPAAARARLLLGAALFHGGREADAVRCWNALADAYPDEPLAWKARAEAEGHGPIVRGFEVYGAVPAPALATATSRAADGVYAEADLWRRGVDFLCAMQRSHGGWVDSRYDFGGTDSLPNVHVAISAIAASALLDAADREPRAAAGLERAVAFVTDEANYNPDDRDELVWARAYTARLLCRLLAEPARGERLRPALLGAVRGLQALQPETGAWYHEYSNPFVTASVLIALHDAERAGVEVDAAAVELGLRALARCRADDGAISYGYGRRPRSGGIAAAAGRMPLAEHARLLWGVATPVDLDAALDAAFEHHDELASVRKYDDHAHRLGYGGFFFWYDMLGRCEAIAAVADGERRQRLAARQRALVLALPEIDGCFVDSHELGRVYGTAMALRCLAVLGGA